MLRLVPRPPGPGYEANALCVARYSPRNVQIEEICAYFGCGRDGRGYHYTAIWLTNGSSWPLDRRYLLIEAFLAKSTSCIARECHEKLTDHDNSSYKPEMKSLESGQTDRQTDRQTDKQTTVTLSRMRQGLINIIHIYRLDCMQRIIRLQWLYRLQSHYGWIATINLRWL